MTSKLTDTGIKRLILVTALEVEVEGMKADNEQRTNGGWAASYGEAQFDYVATQIREIANMSDEEVLKIKQ